MKKTKAKKIPSSMAKFKRLLVDSLDEFIYARREIDGDVHFYVAPNAVTDALWAMPLKDIAKRKGRARR